MFFASSLGYLIGSFTSGRLYDRIDGHKILAVVLLMTSVALFLVPFIASMWLLTAILLLSGMFSGAIDVGGNTLQGVANGHKVFDGHIRFFYFLRYGKKPNDFVLLEQDTQTGIHQVGYLVRARRERR